MAKRYTLQGLPRPPTLGKILPGAGRNVTVGDKVGNRWHCEAMTERARMLKEKL